MRVYVGGKTHHFELVREVQQMCRDAGMTITYDWTTAVEHHGAEHELELPTDEQAAQFAHADIEGVRTADLVIALAHPRWAGTLIEIGGAMVKEIPLLLLGQPYAKSIFWRHNSVYMLNDYPQCRDTLEYVLKQLAGAKVTSSWDMDPIGRVLQELKAQATITYPAMEGRSA